MCGPATSSVILYEQVTFCRYNSESLKPIALKQQFVALYLATVRGIVTSLGSAALVDGGHNAIYGRHGPMTLESVKDAFCVFGLGTAAILGADTVSEKNTRCCYTCLLLKRIYHLFHL